MSIFHDEIEIEDFEYCEEEDLYTYPCPCGDEFIITKEELMDGLEEATCPSCSLKVKVIYNKEDFKREHIEIEEKLGSMTLKETKVCN
ncbi:diphthamide biosynthesis protein 3 [Chironomus tepperi]|uniref:diphthamide biosynthesis protein 3 n=1 Tax=Chironomus tepperi TaxID=113505 RepID=UPI00391F1370